MFVGGNGDFIGRVGGEGDHARGGGVSGAEAIMLVVGNAGDGDGGDNSGKEGGCSDVKEDCGGGAVKS